MKLPYARHAAPAVSVSRQFAKSDVIFSWLEAVASAFIVGLMAIVFQMDL